MSELEFYEKLSIARGVMVCICGEEVACYHTDCLALCEDGLELLGRRKKYRNEG